MNALFCQFTPNNPAYYSSEVEMLPPHSTSAYFFLYWTFRSRPSPSHCVLSVLCTGSFKPINKMPYFLQFWQLFYSTIFNYHGCLKSRHFVFYFHTHDFPYREPETSTQFNNKVRCTTCGLESVQITFLLLATLYYIIIQILLYLVLKTIYTDIVFFLDSCVMHLFLYNECKEGFDFSSMFYII